MIKSKQQIKSWSFEPKLMFHSAKFTFSFHFALDTSVVLPEHDTLTGYYINKSNIYIPHVFL